MANRETGRYPRFTVQNGTASSYFSFEMNVQKWETVHFPARHLKNANDCDVSLTTCSLFLEINGPEAAQEEKVPHYVARETEIMTELMFPFSPFVLLLSVICDW